MRVCSQRMWLLTLMCSAGLVSLSSCRGQDATNDAAAAMGTARGGVPIEMLIIYGTEVKEQPPLKPVGLTQIFDHRALAYYLEYLAGAAYDVKVTVLISHSIAEDYQKVFEGFDNVRFQVLEAFSFPKSYDHTYKYCIDGPDECIAYSKSWVMPSFLVAMNHLAQRRGSLKRELSLNLRGKPGMKEMFRHQDSKKVVVSLIQEHTGLYSNEAKTTQTCLASNVSKLDLYVHHRFSWADIGNFIYGLSGALSLGMTTLSKDYKGSLVSPSAQGDVYFKYGRCDVIFADFKSFMDKEYGSQAKNDFKIFIFNPSVYAHRVNNEYKLIAEEYNGQYYQRAFYGDKIDWWQQVFGTLPELAGLSPQPYVSEEALAVP